MLNAKSLRAKREVVKMDILCARCNSVYNIVAINLMFDVMAFMLQFNQIAGVCDFSVVPNTVQTCFGPFRNKATVMTSAKRPYMIIQVNRQWEEMTGWKAEDVVGKLSCKVLQGSRTGQQILDELMSYIRRKRHSSIILINRVRGRENFFGNYMNLYPLSKDSKVSYCVDWLGVIGCKKST